VRGQPLKLSPGSRGAPAKRDNDRGESVLLQAEWVFAPFVITYISTEHGPEHTPDYRLAFGVEAAWVLGLLVIGGLVVLIQRSRNQK
jgi:hypothetical protein